MEFQYRYFGHSQASSSGTKSQFAFVPDSLRQPTFFVAELAQHMVFREAISALNAIVVSDLRFKPKDRSEYFAWLAQEEETSLATFLEEQKVLTNAITPLKKELEALYQQSRRALHPYYQAQRQYFNYLYKMDKDAWFVFDPVITVHPDQVFFECFSQDESSYGRLSCQYDVFKNIDELAYGTTNIDYSAGLYQEFQKIRDYRKTEFKIDPSGFAVQTEHSEQFIEQKIDLPDSWVRGFLQVNSALTMPMLSVELHPMDVHNICFYLRRHKERVGPRSLRIMLKPDQAVEILIEPWRTVLKCPRSVYQGTQEQEVRLWGRRRLLMLERLIPIAKRFTVHLLGTGLPSFWMADLGDMQFTLGLSGWTANDWSRAGHFDLMAPRGEVDSQTAERVIAALQQHWCATAQTLAKALALSEPMVKSALALYAQQGRVLFDTESHLYRLRELSAKPLPLAQLRFDNPREANAAQFQAAGLVSIHRIDESDGVLHIRGEVMDNAKHYHPHIYLDADQRLFQAECDCDFYTHHRLHQGPCEHMLALRIKYAKYNSKADLLCV